MSSHPLSELEDISLASFKRQQLTRLCSRYGLPSSGTRSALILRLRNAVADASEESSSGSRRSYAVGPPPVVRSRVSEQPPPHRPSHKQPAYCLPLLQCRQRHCSRSQHPRPPPSTVCPPVPLSLGTSSAGGYLGQPSPSYLLSVAQLAAQAAIAQALQLAPLSTPSSIPTPQPLFTSVAASQPVTPSTASPLQVPLLPPVLSNLTVPAPHPPTSSVVQAFPQPPATANSTSYNLPGELSGMIQPNVIQKNFVITIF